MEAQIENQEKKFWQSANFWIILTTGVIGGFFVGFPREAVSAGIGALFALVYSGAILRDAFADLKFDWKKAIGDKNWWNYLAGIIVMLIPSIPLEVFDQLAEIAAAALGGNWQGVLVGVFGLLTILYHIFIKKEPVPKRPGQGR
jgi:hypothetical protein